MSFYAEKKTIKITPILRMVYISKELIVLTALAFIIVNLRHYFIQLYL